MNPYALNQRQFLLFVRVILIKSEMSEVNNAAGRVFSVYVYFLNGFSECNLVWSVKSIKCIRRSIILNIVIEVAKRNPNNN